MPKAAAHLLQIVLHRCAGEQHPPAAQEAGQRPCRLRLRVFESVSLVTDEEVADAVLASQAAGVQPKGLIAHDEHLPTQAERGPASVW